ncbi:MAG: DUF4252 domain-containing protein [Xanthomonadales bacterium]|nr:DUF4252 domain-containing protein [Xanthomonadales bacterium]
MRAAARFAAALAATTALAACGITAPRGHDGWADLDSPGVFDTDRSVSLSIGPMMLGIAAAAVDEDEPETAALLRGLDGVRIRVYEIDGDPQRVAGRLERMSRRLQSDLWQSVLLTREDDEQTHMLMLSDRGRMRGLILLTTDGVSEVVVINILGDLQPRQFNRVAGALDLGTPVVRPAAPGNTGS